MAKATFQGHEVNTRGNFPLVGTQAPEFSLVKTDLSEITLADLRGQRVVLNIFPSLDTGVCATTVRTFNKLATNMMVYQNDTPSLFLIHQQSCHSGYTRSNKNLSLSIERNKRKHYFRNNTISRASCEEQGNETKSIKNKQDSRKINQHKSKT